MRSLSAGGEDQRRVVGRLDAETPGKPRHGDGHRHAMRIHTDVLDQLGQDDGSMLG